MLVALWSIAVLAMAIAEGVILHHLKKNYDWRAFYVSVGDALLKPVVDIFARLVIWGPVIFWFSTIAPQKIKLGFFAEFAILFLGTEFIYYWWHRAHHRIRWFWASHSVHHSPASLNYAASFRTGITIVAAGSSMFFIPLVLLGFSPEAVFGLLFWKGLSMIWLHSEWTPKLGVLEAFLNTPSHHRVHHARNPEYLDVNYGASLIIFDKIFGTFVAERDDVPCEYGLVGKNASNNIFTVEFGEWRSLCLDCLRARSMRNILEIVFGPPDRPPIISGQFGGTTVARERDSTIPASAFGETAN